MDRQGVLHLMGTDHLGRDVMAGFICGMEIAIILGTISISRDRAIVSFDGFYERIF
jgi:ABC-type dipeptide/oligopeptide/nickel transport system permease subunit